MNNRQITPEMARAELGRRSAARAEILKRHLNNNSGESISNRSKLSNYIPNPPMPIGMNIASGLMSLAGRNPQEKDIIRNIPSITSGQKPDITAKFGQGIGEMLPLEMSGIGAVPGMIGTAARVAGTTGYGAALNPEDRIGGAGMGLIAGLGGEAIPGSLRTIGSVAEKINPIKFAKSKISEMIEKFKNAEKRQAESYEISNKYHDKNVLDDPMVKIGYSSPKQFLDIDTEGLSPKSKNIYEKFLKDSVFGNLHDLQSQLFKDMKTYKLSNPDTFQKSSMAREKVIEKAKEFLGKKDPKALSGYEKGTNITREELKPYLETPELRKLISEKIKSMQPKKLESVIRNALEKETSKIPGTHHLRQVQNELENRLQGSELIDTMIPEYAKKMLPNFAELAQNPMLLRALQRANIGYQPLKTGLTGKFLER